MSIATQNMTEPKTIQLTMPRRKNFSFTLELRNDTWTVYK